MAEKEKGKLKLTVDDITDEFVERVIKILNDDPEYAEKFWKALAKTAGQKKVDMIRSSSLFNTYGKKRWIPKKSDSNDNVSEDK